MTPLLRPARNPNPDILVEELGLSASALCWGTREEFEVRKAETLRLLQSIVGSTSLFTRSELEGSDDTVYVVYELDSVSNPSISFGNVSFSYSGTQHQRASLVARILWRLIPDDIERVVKIIDTMWLTGAFDMLYVYDEDDFTMQNLTTPVGIEHYGIDESQVVVCKKGTVNVIDPTCNPGFWANIDGVQTSIQWLNYWSLDAQEKIFGAPVLGDLPSQVEVTELDAGAVKVRLAERPGKYDGEAFHLLQLACRRCLGLTV